jgi:hypothetical protein
MSHQERTPMSHYEYPIKNIHGNSILEYGKENTLVHEDPNLRQGFSQIPNVILSDSLLTDKEVRLYCLLLRYSWKDGHCFPGQDTLAKDMGCDQRTVIRTIKKLANYKLIRIKRQGLNRPNIYFIRRLTDAYPVLSDSGSKF